MSAKMKDPKDTKLKQNWRFLQWVTPISYISVDRWPVNDRIGLPTLRPLLDRFFIRMVQAIPVRENVYVCNH